jgi:hypothetical protein
MAMRSGYSVDIVVFALVRQHWNEVAELTCHLHMIELKID